MTWFAIAFPLTVPFWALTILLSPFAVVIYLALRTLAQARSRTKSPVIT